MTEELLTCPICGLGVKNLVSHLRRSHDNSLKDRAAVEARFPELKGSKMQITKFDKSKEYVCEICGRVYHRKNDIQNHIRTSHPESYQKTIKTTQPQLTCPICNKSVGNLRQHVRESHELKWDDFCSQYNWDKTLVKIVTDEYRKKLSDNKKKYYASESGQERKRKQSKYWKENNPVYNPEMLSKSIYNRTKNGKLLVIAGDLRGIKVQCDGLTFRSFTEFEFYVLCLKYKFDVIYEPNNYCVKWFNEDKKFLTTYLPDFYIEGVGLIELKHDKYFAKKSKGQQKYIKVSKVYDKMKIPFGITCPDDFFRARNIELDFNDTQYIKEFIKSKHEANKITIISPYRHSPKLKHIFDVDDLTKVDCIRFTEKSNYNLYGEM